MLDNKYIKKKKKKDCRKDFKSCPLQNQENFWKALDRKKIEKKDTGYYLWLNQLKETIFCHFSGI